MLTPKDLTPLVDRIQKLLERSRFAKVTAHSKNITPHSLFFALQGARRHGMEFLSEAVRAGAGAIITDHNPSPNPQSSSEIPIEHWGSLAQPAHGIAASLIRGRPSSKLKMIGVTGTSGKTTVTHRIFHALNSLGISCALLGTNGGKFKGQFWDTTNTTPDPDWIQEWLSEVYRLGATHVVMEVSSHGLQQHRVMGTEWDSVAFLNLSQDHLDTHGTMEQYFNEKLRLFHEQVAYSQLFGKNPHGVTNIECPWGAQVGSPYLEVFRYTPQSDGDFFIENQNMAIAVLQQWGVTPQQALKTFETFTGADGRMEEVKNPDVPARIFVDYAHKPEALKKVLIYGRKITPPGGRLTVVFGCGGNRDKTKRPIMGAIAAELADRIVLTADNPRFEDPEIITDEIEAGVNSVLHPCAKQIERIMDRESAIIHTLNTSQLHDVIIIAGKGHESTQKIKDQHLPCDDRVISKSLKTRGSIF